MKKIHLFHNIISPYKTLLFNELNSLLGGDLKVIYCTNTAGEREWLVDRDKIQYEYEVLNEVKLEKLSQVKLSIQVFKYLCQHRPKTIVVGGYDLLAFWLIWLWRLVHNVKFVVIMESQEQDHQRNAVKEVVKKIFFSVCDLAIAAGEKHRQYLCKLGLADTKIVVMKGVGGVEKTLYNKYLQQYHNEVSKEELYDKFNIPKRKYFIYVGRFSPEKNIRMLLQAYAETVKELGLEEQWGIILVGSGKQEPELRSLINYFKLKNIIMPGFVQQEFLPQYYLVSKVFVLPSLSEPWGLVVDEAISLGLPVLISERCGSVPDIVQPGFNGLTFNPDNLSELKNRISLIVRDKIDLELFAQRSLAISRANSPLKSAEIIARGLGKL